MKKQKMNIVMVDSLIGNDYTLCLSLALQAQGMNIRLIVPENRELDPHTPFKVKRWSPAKNDSYGLITKTYKYLFYLLRLFFYAVANRNSIYHFQFFRRRGDAVLFHILSLLRLKLVFTAHNVLPHERKMLDRYLRSLVYSGAKAIIVHSGYIKNKLLTNFNVDEKKIHIVPHGNFDIYQRHNGTSVYQARKKLNLSDQDKVLLFFGFIREYKGLDMLIEAFSSALQMDSRLKLVIAGKPVSNSLEQKYMNTIKETGANGNIITRFDFIRAEEVQDYFKACDVVVLPYKDIDHSGIVHLAYSFHRPVIVSNVGDFYETIEEGKSGFVLSENAAARLSETILAAMSDMDRLMKMGEYAGHLSDTKYSWSDASSKTEKVYGGL